MIRQTCLAGLVLAAILTLLSCQPLPSPGSPAPTAPIEITILHVNDTHGRLLPELAKTVDPTTPVGGAAYLAAAIEDERAKNPDGTLMLSAGDMFQGTPISNVLRGEPMIEVMNALRFDALTLGNHEFDWGRSILLALSRKAAFPFVSANLSTPEGGSPEGIKPYVMLERKGITIAVIGLITTDVAFTTNPEYVKDLTVSDPKDVLPGIIDQVRKQGARLVVVLSHSGLDVDEEIARTIPGIDLIVGGHTHTAVTKPVIVGPTAIVQAGSYGIWLGITTVKLAASGGTNPPEITGELKLIHAGPSDRFDRTIAAIVDGYDARIREKYAQVIGETTIDLELEGSRERETALGDLVCDIMRAATGAEIAFQNGGGLRSSINKGKITLEQAFMLLPFDNVVVTLDLTGATIRGLFEHSAQSVNGILQQAGVTVVYNAAKPAGQRVVSILVAGQPLDDARTYRVVTNDFLLAGGDGFIGFKEGRTIVYGPELRDLFVDYLKKNSPVKPVIEQRIVWQ